MKFLTWLLNLPSRYRRQARRYSKGGKFQRLFMFLFLTVFVGGSLYLEYFSFNMFTNEGNAIGILLLIVAIIFTFSSVEMSGMHSFFGFKTATIGSMDDWIEKTTRKQKADQGHYETSIDEVNVERRVPRWLDILLGFYFAIIAIAGVAMFLYIAAKFIG